MKIIQLVLEQIEELVQEIYTPDQKKINERYLAFVEAIAAFIEEMQIQGYTVDLRADLEKIQNAYIKKDYVLLSDILSYEMKKDFENLEASLTQ